MTVTVAIVILLEYYYRTILCINNVASTVGVNNDIAAAITFTIITVGRHYPHFHKLWLLLYCCLFEVCSCPPSWPSNFKLRIAPIVRKRSLVCTQCFTRNRSMPVIVAIAIFSNSITAPFSVLTMLQWLWSLMITSLPPLLLLFLLLAGITPINKL